MSKTVLIAGGTGAIGTRLSALLTENGYTVKILSRDPSKVTKYLAYRWDLHTKYFDLDALIDVDCIINLTGAPVTGERWTADYKKQLYDSRIKAAELLHYTLKTSTHKVSTYISPSAIGFYGDTGDSWVDENSLPGFDFLANLCKQWEHGNKRMNELGLRVVIVRIGIMFDLLEGAFPKLVQPIKMYLGAPIGSGNQYISWIYIDDLSQVFLKAISDKKIQGIYNAVSPEPITNREFNRAVATILDRPLWLPSVPEWALNLYMGEAAVIATSGQRVSSEKLKASGFQFQYPNLEMVLKHLLKDPNA